MTNLDDLDRKINFLLSETTGVNQWLTTNKPLLTKMITQQKQLDDAGITPEKFIDQMRYVSDLNTYNKVIHDLNTHSSDGVFSLSDWLFITNHYSDFLIKAKSINGGSLFSKLVNEGLIIISINQLAKTRLPAGFLFDASFHDLKLSVVAQSTNFKLDISYQNDTKTGNFQLDTVSGLNTTGVIENPGLIILIRRGNVLSNFQLLFHAETGKYEFIQTGSMIIDFMDYFLNNLPLDVGYYTKVVDPVTLEDNLLRFLFLEKVKNLPSQITKSFENLYEHDITWNLYGLGTATTISKVQNLIMGTVHATESNYQISSPVSGFANLSVPETVPHYKLHNRIYNKNTLFADALFEGRFVDDVRIHYLPDVGSLPSAITQDDRGTDCGTFFDLNEYRKNLTPIKISRVSKEGETSECDAWFENVITDVVENSKMAGTMWYCNRNNGPASLRLMSNASALLGVKATIYDPNKILKPNDVLNIVTGHHGVYNFTVTTRLILAPGNLLNMGVSSIIGRVNYSLNGGAQIDTELAFTRQTIRVEKTERIVYVAILKTEPIQNVPIGVGSSILVTLSGSVSTSAYIGLAKDADDSQIPSTFYSTLSTDDVNSLFCTKKLDWFGYKPWIFDDFDTNKKNLTKSNNNGIYGYFNGYSCPSHVTNISHTIYNDGVHGIQPPFVSSYENVATSWPWEISDMCAIHTVFQSFAKNITTTSGNFIKADSTWLDANLDGFKMVSAVDTQTSVPTGTYAWWDGERFQFRSSFPCVRYTFKDLPSWLTPSSGFATTQPQDSIKVFNLTLNTTEIIVPDHSSSDSDVPEDILKLESAVRLLEHYSAYLTMLIGNLDKRVEYVTNSISGIVQYLTEKGTKNGWGIAGTIVSFIGDSLGMFFPLIGLAINVAGEVLGAIGPLTNGDVVQGAIDLTAAALMAAMGVYKFNQRLSKKYGTGSTGDPLPVAPDIGVPALGYRSQRASVGDASITWHWNPVYDPLSPDRISISSIRSGYHGLFQPDRLGSDISHFNYMLLTTFDVELDKTIPGKLGLKSVSAASVVKRYIDRATGIFKDVILTQTDFNSAFHTSMSLEDYSLLLLATNPSSKVGFSDHIAYDPDVFSFLGIAYGYRNAEAPKPSFNFSSSSLKSTPLIQVGQKLDDLYFATNSVAQLKTSQQNLFSKLIALRGHVDSAVRVENLSK